MIEEVKQLFTQVSGKVGDVVGAHNQGGSYFRKFTKPSTAGSPARTKAQNAMAAASNRWNDDLTIEQRAEWKTYAKNTPLKGTQGRTLFVTGRNMFIRSFVVARLIPGPDPIDAPTLFNLGRFTPISFTQGNPQKRLNIFFTESDEWNQAMGGALYVKSAPAVTNTINFYKAPFRTAGSIRFLGSPQSSPQSINQDFSYNSGDRIFVEVSAMHPDGRLTQKQITFHDVP